MGGGVSETKSAVEWKLGGCEPRKTGEERVLDLEYLLINVVFRL